MSILSRRDGDTVEVALAGELDLATSPAVRESLADLLARDPAPQVLIDLREVTFCDSSGIETLVQTRIAAVAQGRTVRLINVHGITRTTLEITGVLALFTDGDDGSR